MGPDLRGGFSPLILYLCVSFPPKLTLSMCCDVRWHQDALQHVHRESLCLCKDLHKLKELCHHPLSQEALPDLHTLPVSSECAQSVSVTDCASVSVFYMQIYNFKCYLKSKFPKIPALGFKLCAVLPPKRQ